MSVKILQGDCREILKSIPECSIDSCVTDPPYELGFMGKAWDSSGVAFDPETWKQVLRVLKPGAHLLAFGGTRTHHRIMCAIEDAGFEIRDCLGWLYGSGFPKSHNLSGDGEGWGTALKPAWEPIIMARKPFKGTVAANFEAHGTGAINIDACRIATNDELREGSGGIPCRHDESKSRTGEKSADTRYDKTGGTNFAMKPGRRSEVADVEGRWPANIIHDGSDEVASIFPSEAGAAAPVTVRNSDKFRNTFGAFAGNRDEEGSTFRGDSGSAARFFYCAKPTAAEREIGLQGRTKKIFGMSGAAAAAAARGEHYDNGDGGVNKTKMRANNHPTVKPVELMRYLIRLVTPKGGTVLDCFLGSGTTARSAHIEGFDCIGVELNPEYIEIAKGRIDGDTPLFADSA